jgi:glycerate kinase
LQALGIEFLNAKTQPFERPITGSDLENISDFRIAFEPQIPRRLNVTLACDVDNPLCGPNGASMVFGPQKGADQETAKQLDIAMAAYAPLLDRIALTRGGKAADSPIAEIPGSGAAGGLSAALMAFFPESQIRPGIDIALDDGRFGQKAQDADLILVGEGRLDSQTLSGKAIEGVLRRVTTALGKKPPVISFSGLVDPEAANDLKARGLDAAYGISEISDSLEESMANAEELLERLVRERLKDWNPLPDR